ncbi:MAG: hypothetical protein HYY20_10755 [Candidatus Tectomicrobia bacterium]|uniref:CRISPR-associated protein Cas6 C-terminal domain-containing protein n=1 Tax=Tectimicrobiota bacterium TaxID=2528274 RepID=A0A932FW23_UNCTE|nr:hypothetical protein [Candidatus Tectomicrobia bacterium]
MWNFISSVNLIRYLMVWRVNSPLVQRPPHLSAALSQVLGTIIANRLPTRPAREWRKALEAWGNATATPPPGQPPKKPGLDLCWPIEATLFAYPGKRTYGPGEIILWELKLVADSADHRLFLELVLPAMEEAASTSDPRWYHANSLWGHFDIHAVYAARGMGWDPVVSEGRLNLNYRTRSTQWAEGLTFGLNIKRDFRRLTWITPFDLGEMPGARDALPHSPSTGSVPSSQVPNFLGMLDALIDRMRLFLPGKNPAAKDAWALLSPGEQTEIWQALQQAKPLPRQHQKLESAPKGGPGRWIGTQAFTTIPHGLLPYLELASILHIGKQTHFGCGTFTLA